MSVSRRSCVLAGTTLAATVVGLGAATVQAAGAAAPAPTSTAWVHTSKTTAATTVLPRTAIPWKSVGTGWLAADVVRGGAPKLVLVSPAGQPYEIGSLRTNETVTAIAHDGRHVVTVTYTDGLPDPRVWDLRSGKASALPRNMDRLTFTRPDGTAVMVFNEVGSYARYSMDGKQQKVVANPGGRSDDTRTLTPNPDGRTDAVSTSDESTGSRGGSYASGWIAGFAGDKIVYASAAYGETTTTKRMVAEYDVKTKKLVYLVGNTSAYPGQVGGYAVIDSRS